MRKIALVKLGHIKQRIGFRKIQKRPSKIFTVTSIEHLPNIPDGRTNWQQFEDTDFDFVTPIAGADITVALTEYSLQDNYYLRFLGQGRFVMSFCEVAEILMLEGIPLENFLIRNLYLLCALYELYGSEVGNANTKPKIFHDETRSCLFDMNGLKTDIVFSVSRPHICEQCRAAFSRKQLPDRFVDKLSNELRRIKRPLYRRILDFTKSHPVWAIVFGMTGGLFTQIFGSALYDLIKTYLVFYF